MIFSKNGGALPVHACIMFSEEGFPLRHECYKHEVQEAAE